MPGSLSSSWFSTHNPAYVSRDHHTTFMELYPPGPGTVSTSSDATPIRAAAAHGLAAGITVDVTGHDPLEQASTNGSSGGSSVLVTALVGGLGALVILLFVFGTRPAVLVPLVVAAAAILNTFTLVWALSYVTSVSIVVEFLIALVGLGVAVDYALLMIFAFLYGLSMDYEVFMLTRIRPGYENKEFAIALADGIIVDAIVIRALLVPALMRLLGHANWWLPSWIRTILLRKEEPRPGAVAGFLPAAEAGRSGRSVASPV